MYISDCVGSKKSSQSTVHHPTKSNDKIPHPSSEGIVIDICTIDITNIPNMVVKIAAKIPAISMLRNKHLPFGVTVGTFTNGKIKIICEPTKTNTEIPTPIHET